MSWQFKQEIARKFVHFLSIFILFIYFLASDIFSPKIARIILVLILIIFLEFEYLRIETSKKIPVMNKVWAYLRRTKEKKALGADIFFLIGAILVLAVFDTKIAVAAILMTTFGDLAAALVGKKFGKHKISFAGKKSWEGTAAELAVNIVIGICVFIFYAGSVFSSFQGWTIIIIMSLTATLVEVLANKIDDNLLIPVFAGFNGQIILLIFKYFS